MSQNSPSASTQCPLQRSIMSTAASGPVSLRNIRYQSVQDNHWWRSSVIYQIYPRSFADGNDDGIGDLKGIVQRLDSLAALGVDALWLSPFFKSPQKDAGYDISDYKAIDPLFGTMDDFDTMVAEAKARNMRIIVDLVPNHSSDQHELFQAALKAGPGSPERDMYIFREGRQGGTLPPNNWPSVFGGQAWSRVREPDGSLGQWYLHIFDSSQPDFNWTNPKVLEYFDSVIRFWLDRGVAGFRIDVAHGLVKREGLPDLLEEHADSGFKTEVSMTIEEMEEAAPYWGQPGIHDINRRWRAILREYGEDRVMCAEAWVMPLERMARWVRPDEYNQTFNFGYMFAGWSRDVQIKTIEDSLASFGKVGAPCTWVLSNHDVVRHTTRYGLADGAGHSSGVGPDSPQPDDAIGLQRARAATAFMLGLPGGVYLYQGEELGLPEHTTLEGQYRQDPTYHRTNGARIGRDGCRIPLPWEADASASYGFSASGKAWLPMPDKFKMYARDAQEGVSGSTLELYKGLIGLRKSLGMGFGSFCWMAEHANEHSLAYLNKDVLVLANFGQEPVKVPAGELLMTTQRGGVEDGLQKDHVAWVRM